MFSKNPKKSLVLLLTIFLVVSAYIGYTAYLEWDEGSFLMNSRNIAGDTVNSEPSRPMALSFLISFIWKFTGESILFARLLTTVFGLGCIALFYSICNEKFEDPIIPTLVFSLSPLILFWSSQVMTDIPGLFFLLSAYYFYLKRNDFMTGISISFAITFRYIYSIFAVPFFIAYLLDREDIKDVLFYAGGGILGAMPFFIYSFISHGGPLEKAFLYIGNVSEWSGASLFASTWENLVKMIQVFFALIPGVLKGRRETGSLEKITVVFYSLFILLFVGMSFYRYWVPMIPFVIIIAYKGLDKKHFLVFSAIFLVVSGNLVYEEYQERKYCYQEFMEGIEYLKEFDGGVVSDRWSITGYMLEQKVLSPYKDYELFKNRGMEYIFTTEKLDYPVKESFRGDVCTYYVYQLE